MPRRAKLRHSRAKERQLERERKMRWKEVLQPFDEKGKRSAKFERIYGDRIFNIKKGEKTEQYDDNDDV